MAAPKAFSGQATGQSTFSRAIVVPPCFFPPKSCQLKSNSMKITEQQLCSKARLSNKPYMRRRLKMITSSTKNSDLSPDRLSASETIKQFYTCINDRDLKQLAGLVSKDCSFDDCSFLKPFQGRKEVMEFFGQLLASMGQNVDFKVELVCEGDDYTIGVSWHLEWNKIEIPFTRGCSFFECSMDEAKLVIKRAQVITESPVKPGGSALVLFKILTSLLDAFPKAAEWFLKSPHVLLQWIIKAYDMVLGPFISPFLAWYINIWKFIARLLSYALGMFHILCHRQRSFIRKKGNTFTYVPLIG
ncbi:hypothetical protein NMG60_11030468 [Bertholletia excelsa]